MGWMFWVGGLRGVLILTKLFVGNLFYDVLSVLKF